jgi:hypothetical protein
MNFKTWIEKKNIWFGSITILEHKVGRNETSEKATIYPTSNKPYPYNTHPCDSKLCFKINKLIL